MTQKRKQVRSKRENYKDLIFRGWDDNKSRPWLEDFVAFLRERDRKTIVSSLSCISMIIACLMISSPAVLITVVVTSAVFGLLIVLFG
jgi:hypothetical protein